MDKIAVYPLIDSWGGVRKGTPARCAVRIWLVGVETKRVEGFVDLLSYVILTMPVIHGLEYGVCAPDRYNGQVRIFESNLSAPEMSGDAVWAQVRALVNSSAYGWEAQGGIWDVTSHTCEHCSFLSFGDPDCSHSQVFTVHALFCSNPYSKWGAPVRLDESCEGWAPIETRQCD